MIAKRPEAARLNASASAARSTSRPPRRATGVSAATPRGLLPGVDSERRASSLSLYPAADGRSPSDPTTSYKGRNMPRPPTSRPRQPRVRRRVAPRDGGPAKVGRPAGLWIKPDADLHAPIMSGRRPTNIRQLADVSPTVPVQAEEVTLGKQEDTNVTTVSSPAPPSGRQSEWCSTGAEPSSTSRPCRPRRASVSASRPTGPEGQWS